MTLNKIKANGRTDISVTDVLATRRSIRAFTAQSVDTRLLRAVLAKAQHAPSGGNLQPWQAIVLTGDPWEEIKTAVAERTAMGRDGQQMEYPIYPDGLPDPWHSRRFAIGEALYDSIGITRDNRAGRLQQFMENFRGFGAPVMIFLYCSRIMGPPQWADMGMWLQSLMLLLVEVGLASCPQECWATYGATIRQTLGLGEEQILFTGLAIGYPDTTHPINSWAVPRAPLDEVLDFRGF